MHQQIIIFTGKGGVGKTSVAAAHALKAAGEGQKTLIVSTDMAHNLGDIFQHPLKENPVEITSNLWGLELDPNYELQQRFETIKQALVNTMNLDAHSRETVEDIVVFPGMEEIFCLLRIKELYEAGTYDLIIVDCAPTGETLSLLKFPEMFQWMMEKYLPMGKRVLKLIRPVSKLFFKVEIPGNETINDIERLFILLVELQRLLRNRNLCTLRLVTICEKMIIEETKRSFMYMNLYDFNVDGIYINRLIPGEVKNPFFTKWKLTQSEYLREIEDSFPGMPFYKIKWYETDIQGLPHLQRLAEDSLTTADVLNIRELRAPQEFFKTPVGYKFELKLPFSGKEKFDLYETGTEIIIKIGNFKRNIPCPDILRQYSISKAKLEDQCLAIYFEAGRQA